MHIHAQSQVELDCTVVRMGSGSDQHAAITTSITIPINMSTPPSSMFGAIGMWIEKRRAFVGTNVSWSVKTRGFAGPDVRWTVKTRGFVGPDVRGTVKTRGFVDPSVQSEGAREGLFARSAADKFLSRLLRNEEN